MGSTDTHTTTQRQFTSLQLPTYTLKYNFSLEVLHKPDFLRQVLGAYLLPPEQYLAVERQECHHAANPSTHSTHLMLQISTQLNPCSSHEPHSSRKPFTQHQAMDTSLGKGIHQLLRSFFNMTWPTLPSLKWRITDNPSKNINSPTHWAVAASAIAFSSN